MESGEDEEPFGHLPDGDGDGATSDDRTSEPERREQPRRATAALATALTVLGDVLAGRAAREEIPHVVEASGEPVDDPVDVVLDPNDPTASRATIRPWLLRRR